MGNDELKKALHKIVMKAYRKGQESISKEHAVNHIVHDLADPNKKPEVPKSHIPAASESVLHKEMKPGQAVSEMHNQKQMNAQANLGMRPGSPGAGGAAKPPKMGGGMPKMGAAPMAAPAGAGAPAGASSGGKPKAPKPLKNFMMRMSEKRGGAPMAKNSPKHPGPSKSEHQKIYDAKTQAASEAHLKTPKGDAARKAGNAARMATMTKARVDEGKSIGAKVDARRDRNWRTKTVQTSPHSRTVGPERMVHGSGKVVGEPHPIAAKPIKKNATAGYGGAIPPAPTPPPPTVPGGSTINSQIGSPFGKGQKGVHNQMPGHKPGVSVVGHHVRGTKANPPAKWTPVVPIKEQHKMTIAEQKNMKKPILKAEGGQTKHDRCTAEIRAKHPEIHNAHALCVSVGVKPSKWKK